MAKICLVTPAQPSNNPRLVKEADALTEAGHDVHVLYAHVSRWADKSDQSLLAGRKWTHTRVGGHPTEQRWPYFWSLRRLRFGHRLAGIARRWEGMGLKPALLDGWIADRVLGELKQAAIETSADLYIGHNTAALPAVVAAAKKYGARCGFDIEDYFSGMDPYGSPLSPGAQVTERIERKYLPECDYLTVVSSEIGGIYHKKYNVGLPTQILNVFSLRRRPQSLKFSNPGEPLRLYWVSQTIGDERLENVIRAMGALSQLQIELHLRGNWAEGYRDRVMALAAASGVRSECIVSHPVAPADEMINLASMYDVGLVLEGNKAPYNDLCLTNKIFTYVLAGNLIITTATKAHQRVAQELGPAAFCYKEDDLPALIAKLRHWGENPAALRLARSHAWELGKTTYNWEAESAKFLEIVESTLRRDPRSLRSQSVSS